VKYWKTALGILATLSASLALAEDFKTINGKEYKNATVSHIEADGIVLKTKSGISKVYFVELPKEVQQRFGYDATKLAEQAAELQKQQQAAAAAAENQRQIALAQQGKTEAQGSDLPRLTLQQFEQDQFSLVGKTVAVEFNFREDYTRRVDSEWFSGTIWHYDPSSRYHTSFSSAHVLIPAAALSWYQAIPTNYSSDLYLSVYARVEEDSGTTVLRLLGTRVNKDEKVGAKIGW